MSFEMNPRSSSLARGGLEVPPPVPTLPRPPRGRPGQVCAFRCAFRTSLSEYDYGGLFLAAYEGDLYAFLDEDREHLAGHARLFVLNADAAEQAGASLFNVLDQRSETAPFICLLGDAEGELAPGLRALLGPHASTRNMLLLERLEILPSFRGQQLGLQYMRAAITRFGLGCRLVAARPDAAQSTPLRTPRGRARHPQARTAAQELRKHYECAGFVKVPSSDVMILDLDKRRVGR